MWNFRVQKEWLYHAPCLDRARLLRPVSRFSYFFERLEGRSSGYKCAWELRGHSPPGKPMERTFASNRLTMSSFPIFLPLPSPLPSSLPPSFSSSSLSLCHLVPLWSENILCMISILLSVLWYVSWFHTRSVVVNVHVNRRRACSPLLLGGLACTCQLRSRWLAVLLRAVSPVVSSPISCLLHPSVTDG